MPDGIVDQEEARKKLPLEVVKGVIHTEGRGGVLYGCGCTFSSTGVPLEP